MVPNIFNQDTEFNTVASNRASEAAWINGRMRRERKSVTTHFENTTIPTHSLVPRDATVESDIHEIQAIVDSLRSTKLSVLNTWSCFARMMERRSILVN